jgi:hypothetical protein
LIDPSLAINESGLSSGTVSIIQKKNAYVRLKEVVFRWSFAAKEKDAFFSRLSRVWGQNKRLPWSKNDDKKIIKSLFIIMFLSI